MEYIDFIYQLLFIIFLMTIGQFLFKYKKHKKKETHVR